MLRIGDEYLLFDAGRGVVMQMVRAGIPLDRVKHVFITHHHYDHIGDLADVILTSWLQGRRHTLRIFGPPGTRSIVTTLLGQVYDKDIEFRTKGEAAMGGWQPVESTDVMDGLVHDRGNWSVSAEVVVHGHGLDLSIAFTHSWVCLGYRVEAQGKVIAISGDGVACDGLNRLARDADVLVQCCYLAQAEINTQQWAHLARYTLACADTVGKIATKAGVKKLVLTHFRQKSEAMMQEIATDVARDYDGPIVLGQDLTDVLV
jgi:ribonuclease Z